MRANSTDVEVCPHDDLPLADHIEGKPCVVGQPREARSLHNLPIFGWAWREDGKELEA